MLWNKRQKKMLRCEDERKENPMEHTITNKYCLYTNAAHYTHAQHREIGWFDFVCYMHKRNGRQNDDVDCGHTTPE